LRKTGRNLHDAPTEEAKNAFEDEDNTAAKTPTTPTKASSSVVIGRPRTATPKKKSTVIGRARTSSPPRNRRQQPNKPASAEVPAAPRIGGAPVEASEKKKKFSLFNPLSWGGRKK